MRIKTGVNTYPHLLRTWANSILATRGIEKQLRDLYLGHVCAYDQGYVMQLLQKWQQTFMQAKAMEHLDPIGAVVTTEDLEAKLMKLEDQEKTIRKLREEIEAKTIAKKTWKPSNCWQKWLETEKYPSSKKTKLKQLGNAYHCAGALGCRTRSKAWTPWKPAAKGSFF